jgi:glycosyltransferase involved in cell wall biosynthesis
MVNWDNYPNSTSGGVYAWVKQMVDNLPDIEFVVLNVLSNPNVSGSYRVPKNVTQVIELPLYGCQRQEEFCQTRVAGTNAAAKDDSGSTGFIRRILGTDERFIKKTFVPLFKSFMAELISGECDHGRMAALVQQMHTTLAGSSSGGHDFKKCAESPATFDAFMELLRNDDIYRAVHMKEAIDLFSFVQRTLQVISVPLPRVDLVHSSNAWIPALAGLCAKGDSGCRMIATEHGVAFKDLLLYHRLFIHSEAYNILWKIISSNIIQTVYRSADVVAPVCGANAMMAELLHTPASKIRVIYNGVDSDRFRPMSVHRGPNRRPTVVFVGRIELLKDVLSLIQAISYVRETVPDVLCLIYGSSSDLEYANACLELVRSLKLEDNVKFMGPTKSPERAYNAGDVVVLSSIREGFPYTVVEAMACGKVVVSTDVGGVREALENYGLLARSRHPFELAGAISRLLRDTQTRRALAAQALEVVGKKFTVQRSVEQYRDLYAELVPRAATSAAGAGRQQAERGGGDSAQRGEKGAGPQ